MTISQNDGLPHVDEGTSHLLQRLTTSNEVPSVIDANAVQVWLQIREEKLTRLKKTIADLEVQVQEEENAIRYGSPVLSAIKKFPAEILGEIFLHNRPRPLEKFNYPPLGVSRAWRQAALTSAGLWTTIEYGSHAPASNKELELLLRLSGALPLAIHVNAVPGEHAPSRLYSLSPFMAHLDRWESLELVADYQCDQYLEIPNIAAEATLLRNIRIEYRAGGETPDALPVSLVRSATSIVETASSGLKRLAWPFPTSPILGMMNSIVVLDLMNPSVDFGEPPTSFQCTHRDLIQVLRGAPSLVSLKTPVYIPSFRRSPAPPAAMPVLHDKLRTLYICDARGSGALGTWMLNQLTLPALASFEYGWNLDGEGQWPYQAFSDMLFRSQCHLTSLTLMDVPIHDFHVHLESVLKTQRNITDFHLLGSFPESTVHGELLELLTYDDDISIDTQILPKLRHLSLRVSAPSHSLLLEDLITSRSPECCVGGGLSSLEAIRVTLLLFVEEDDNGELVKIDMPPGDIEFSPPNSLLQTLKKAGAQYEVEDQLWFQ